MEVLEVVFVWMVLDNVQSLIKHDLVCNWGKDFTIVGKLGSYKIFGYP